MPCTSAIGTCGEGSMASSRRKRLRRERQAGDGEARVEGVWRALAGGRACCSAKAQRMGPVATRGSARTCMLATWPFCTRLRRERRATCATEVGSCAADGRWDVGVGRASSGRCQDATNGLAPRQARAPHLAKGTGSQGGATPASGKRRPSFGIIFYPACVDRQFQEQRCSYTYRS